MTQEQWSKQEKLKEDLQTILKSDAFKEARQITKDMFELKNSILEPMIWTENHQRVRQHLLSKREGVLAAFDYLNDLALVEDKKTAPKTHEEPFEYLTPEEQEKIDTAIKEEKK